MVTSSAVVGSSAMRSLGSHAIAIAIITRCCCPPDSCEGKALILYSGSGMPTSSSSAIARFRAAPGDSPMCSWRTSLSWKPAVNTGLSEVIGSWKIIDMSAPRILRNSTASSSTRFRPSYRISLPGRTLAFSLGSRPSIDSEVTDLPLPDSPTSATVAFFGMSKLIPLTASKVVSLSSRKLIRRLRTESRVSMASRDPVTSISDPARRARHR